jgi:hypothetical protein
MSDRKEFQRRADECFQRYAVSDHFAKSFWLGLGKQWASMADEAERMPGAVVPTVRPDKIVLVLEEALVEKALALSASRTSSNQEASR